MDGVAGGECQHVDERCRRRLADDVVDHQTDLGGAGGKRGDPAGVPAGTVTVPSGFNTNPAGNTPEVKITSDGTNGNPFKVSFANTLAVLPPGVPLIGVGASFTASIVVTITLVVAVSQTVGLAT